MGVLLCQNKRKLDNIKFDFFYGGVYGDPESLILINGKNLANLIVKEEHKLLSQGKIHFASGYRGLPPERLLQNLFYKHENPNIIWAGTKECFYYHDWWWEIELKCHETQNSIIWDHFRIRISQEKSSNPTMEYGFPYLEFSFYFEFDKKQYYQALSIFFYKLVDCGYFNELEGRCVYEYNLDLESEIKAVFLEVVIPYLNIFKNKGINITRFNKWLQEEKYNPLEDFFKPKRKNERKQFKNKNADNYYITHKSICDEFF